MTRTAALALLADYEHLHRAHEREAYHPREQPPPATLAWYCASHLLLVFCRRLITEGIEDAAAQEVGRG